MNAATGKLTVFQRMPPALMCICATLTVLSGIFIKKINKYKRKHEIGRKKSKGDVCWEVSMLFMCVCVIF